MENVVGYRFIPTDEELINHYLKNKNLGNSQLVDQTINEVDICRYDPPDLPQFSKIKSKDPVFVWYFFSRKEYTSVNKTLRKRRTTSGFWKPTGKDRIIKDNIGNRGEIGFKKSLVFYQGKASDDLRTDWVIHEYHITCLREDQRNYVLCKLMYNVKVKIPSGNISSDPNHSLVYGISTPSEVEQPGEEILNGLHLEDLENPINEQIDRSPWEQFSQNMFDDCHPNVLQVPYLPQDDREFLEDLRYIHPMDVEFLFYENHSISRSMHGSHNDYMPKKSLSGIIANYSSDSEAESIFAMSYQGTSSPSDSVGSSDKHFPTCGDEIRVESNSLSKKSLESQSLQAYANSETRGKFTQQEKHQRSRPLKQKEWFIMEEAMERKRRNPPYIYLMNVIISFILLVGLIGDIISVLLSANY